MNSSTDYELVVIVDSEAEAEALSQGLAGSGQVEPRVQPSGAEWVVRDIDALHVVPSMAEMWGVRPQDPAPQVLDVDPASRERGLPAVAVTAPVREPSMAEEPPERQLRWTLGCVLEALDQRNRDAAHGAIRRIAFFGSHLVAGELGYERLGEELRRFFGASSSGR